MGGGGGGGGLQVSPTQKREGARGEVKAMLHRSAIISTF